MKAILNYTIDNQQRTEVRDFPDSEQGFWREAANVLGSLDVPSAYTIETPCGDAKLDITQRGTFVKNGVESPSMFVVPVFNDIPLDCGKYEDAYLTCINPDTKGGRGNYKFYRLSQKSDGMVTAFYGRIGQSFGFGAEREIREPIPSWMFEIRKAEKLTKGYVDRTDTYCDGDAHVASESAQQVNSDDDLFQKLLAFAQQRVSASLAKGTVVTTAQVENCYKLLKRLGRCRKVDSFNERLLEIMSISPRSVSSVSAQLARTEADYVRIINREESLLAAMRAVASAHDGGHISQPDGFKANGISWSELQGGELESAVSLVPGNLRACVKRVYEVHPQAQRERFTQYLNERDLTDEDVRLMWHGSRNENWCSIVTHSLMLNPNAVITGKMFGYGIYFGFDDCDGGAYKSWNYTSARGSYWANGNSSTAFMGLYECAYGKPYEPKRVGSFDKQWLDKNGFDCVHARGGDCGLQHDEVVFYDESAVCMKYLYEFGV